jgi:hypothetical protein
VTVGLVFLVAGAVQLGTDWFPVGDWAVAELVVRHLPGSLPLSGPYSAQRGYDHPLPFVYLIQWLPYELTGQRSAAGLATAVWWNGLWATFLVYVLARWKAPWLGVLALGSLVLFAFADGSGALLLPWNPNLAIVPGLVFLFVSWRVAVGGRWALPVATGLAIWCVGAHLGFAPLCVAVGLTAAASLVVVTVRRGGRSASRALLAPALASLAVATTLVTPLLVDLVVDGRDSNPVQILNNRPDRAEQRVPLEQAAKVLQGELAVVPAFGRTEPPHDVLLAQAEFRWPLLIPLGAVVAVAAHRRRAFRELAGLGLSLVGLGAATAGLLTLDADLLVQWYLYPAHLASMAFTSFVVWSGGRSALAFARRRASLVAGEDERWTVASTVALPCSALVVTLLLFSQVSLPEFEERSAASLPTIVAAVEEAFDEGEPLLLDGQIDVDGYYAPAIALALERAGFDVRVPDDERYLYTDAMARSEGWTGTRLLVTLSDGPASPPEPGAELVVEAPAQGPFLTPVDTVSVWVAPRP